MAKSFLLFLSSCVFAILLLASEKIIWDTVHYPPSLIAEGEYQNQGFSDMSRDLFIIKLKEYEHEILAGSIQKAMQDIESSKNFCFVGLTQDKDKNAFIHFSKPYIEILPNELAIRTKDLKRFKSYISINNSVNLHRLLQNNGFVFGYTENRLYEKDIDRLIFLNEEKQHLMKRQMDDSIGGLVKVLSEELFDYTIEYPTVLSYTKQELKIDVDFSTFPIMGSDKMVKLYVGCSKNEFGKNVIAQVDKIIEDKKIMFKLFYETWLDYDSKKKYEERIDAKTKR